MLHLALVLVFSVHLVVVYVATAAPFVCLWLEWRESARGDEAAGRLGRSLAKLSLSSLAVGMLLGALTLWLLCQIYPRPYLEALLRMPSLGVWLGIPERLWSTLAELAIFAACMWGYLLTWNLWRDRGGWRRFWGRCINRFLVLFAGTNLLYHLPVLFAVMAFLAKHPQRWDDPGKFSTLMLQPEVVARTLHGWLAACAVTGMVMVLYPFRKKWQQMPQAAVWGARIAAVAVVLQLVAGVYLLFQIDPAARGQLLGEDPISTVLFGGSLLASLGLLHLLAPLAFGEVEKRNMLQAAGLLAAVMLLMAGVRHRLRDADMQRLAPPLVHGEVTAWHTPPQPSDQTPSKEPP